MSAAKVIEISAQSPESFEAANRQGLETTNTRLQNIEWPRAKEQKLDVHDGTVSSFQVDMTATFVLD